MTAEDPSMPAPSTQAPVAPAAQQPYGQAAYGRPGQSPYYAPAGYGPPAPPRGLSIASMVCGIVGLAMSFFFAGFLPALAAVILGHIGRKKEPEARGFSLAGLITGYVGLALSLLAMLAVFAAIFIPFLIATTAPGTGYLNS